MAPIRARIHQRITAATPHIIPIPVWWWLTATPVNIDYTGYVDDVPFDGGSTDGAGTSLTIGSGRYIDDFEEQLIGHHVGETVTVNVTFPEDYSSEELQGKDARFEVTINGIYE